jgi:phosphohistidine phosphatase SixA
MLGTRSLRVLALGLFLVLAAAATSLMANAASAHDGSLWKGLASGEYIALLRHAIAPGTGDPEGFVLRDCTTQRNLSQAGREQAARIGNRLREHGIAAAHVYASQWCRARETAELLRLGPVMELPALNSFFGESQRRDEQTHALAQWLSRRETAGPLVLVTHQVNVTALTGVYPRSGELVIVRRAANGALQVAGTIRTE